MIKFRAWDDVEKEYIKDVLIGSNGKNYFDDGVATQDDLDISIEQFTGLTDVNGKEIYEGDIIVSKPTEPILGSPKIGVVKFSKVSSSWCCETENIEDNIWKTDRYRTYEIIGNVHANPELLEEDK